MSNSNMSARSFTRADSVFEKLAEMIVSGELPPGTIINEAEWADRLDVSRGPIREAVRRLQGRRLISREPFQKSRVVQLSPKNLIDIFELREALEGMACRLATTQLSAKALKELLENIESFNSYSSKQFDFHVAVAHGSGNERIIESLCDDLYYLLRIYRRQSGELLGRSKAASKEHWQIVKAMMARDPDLAESLMRSHIVRAKVNLTNALDYQGG